MPRAPNDRPSRRLDAFLVALRRHGVRTFEAAELEGVGKGLKFSFRQEPPPAPRPQARAPEPLYDPDLLPQTDTGRKPIDALALVAAGLDGPVSDLGDA